MQNSLQNNYLIVRDATLFEISLHWPFDGILIYIY